MEKVFHCPGVDKDGQPLTMLLEPGRMVKTASPVHPEVSRFASNLQPDKNKLYVLLNAMGAAEYYGPNINNDLFDEHNSWADVDNPIIKKAHRCLTNDDPMWGYKTFEKYAHPYQHHRNKNPEESYGSVKLAVWNDPMKRVELIVEIDREKAASVGAQGLVERLDRGEHPDWSMGAKVPYDRCTCHGDTEETYQRMRRAVMDHPRLSPGEAIKTAHRNNPIPGISLTRHDYCENMQKRAGQHLSNGIKVGVHNDFPRFFDISSVFIGADRIAKTISKLAHKEGAVCVGDQCFPSAYVAEAHKLASKDPCGCAGACCSVGDPIEKVASVTKTSDEEKRIPAQQEVVGKVRKFKKGLKELEAHEKDISKNILNAMGQGSPDQALSSAAATGIVLKPREFQRVILVRMGKPDLADQLDRANTVFRPVSRIDRSIPMGPGRVATPLTSMLRGSMGNRSFFGPILHRRVLRIKILPSPRVSNPMEMAHPLLDKVSAAYNGYRYNLIDEIEKIARHVVDTQPDILQEVSGYGLDDLFSGVKVASLRPLAEKALVLSVLPLTYMLSAHIKGKQDAGYETGMLEDFVAKHPLIASMAVAGVGQAVRAARGAP